MVGTVVLRIVAVLLLFWDDPCVLANVPASAGPLLVRLVLVHWHRFFWCGA